MAESCAGMGISDWRQHSYLLKKGKRLFRRVQNLKALKSKDEKKIATREKLVIAAYQTYMIYVETLLVNAGKTLEKLKGGSLSIVRFIEIEKFITHAKRQIDQIERRVIKIVRVTQFYIQRRISLDVKRLKREYTIFRASCKSINLIGFLWQREAFFLIKLFYKILS